MRKITIAAIALTFSSSLAFAQSTSKNEVEAQRSVMGPEEVRTTNVNQRSNQKENTIWSEDFSGGIPSTWVNAGFDGFGNTLDSALWEYRGPNTSPNNTVGSRGAYANPATVIASPTASNGFIIFDSDYLDNAGTAGNFGNGKAPAPHVGTLTTGTINVSAVQNVELRFNSYHRYFEGRALVAFSTDNGVTWPDTVAVHPNLAVNAGTATDEVAGLNVSSYIGGQANVRMRFIFDGNYDDPGASGSGAAYYFWFIDDIELNELPEYEMRFTEWQGAPAQDMIFGPAAGSSKMGILSKNDDLHATGSDQSRNIEFDANVYNYGFGTINNASLAVDIVDAASGTLVSTFTSTGSGTILPGDTLDYNTLNTYGNAFTPTARGTYNVVYKVVSDSTTVVSDTVSIFLTDSLMGLDFNTFDNRTGTPNIGDDGSAFANRIDVTQSAVMTGIWVGLSNTSAVGGVIEAEVFDSTGLDLITGYPSSALVATSVSSYTLTQTDLDNGFVQLPITDGNNSYVGLSPGAYYVAIRMYSNAGANPVYLRNDATFPQPAFSSLMYYTLDPAAPARWYTGFNNSLSVNALHIRAKFWGGIGIEEEMLHSNIKVGPNPTSDIVNVRFEEIEGEFTLTMTDVTGRVISVEDVNVFGAAQHTINVQGLSAGVYMLNINNGKASVTHKISVQ